MESKNNIARFILVLAIGTTLVAFIRFLLPRYGAVVNTFYYFIPLLAVAVTEKSGVLAVLRRYDVGSKKTDLRKSLCYVVVIALAFPLLNMLCVWFFGNVLRIEPFGTFGIPENDFVLYGIRMPENPALRFASLYLFSVGFALVAGLTYNTIFALGSEVAWRGFLNRRLRWGRPVKNIAIGTVWATWWLPVMLFNGYARPSIAVAYVWFILLSFLLDAIFRDTRSLLVTSAVRGVVVSSSCLYFVAGGSPSFNGTGGLAGTISLLVITVCVYMYRRAADAHSTKE